MDLFSFSQTERSVDSNEPQLRRDAGGQRTTRETSHVADMAGPTDDVTNY